MPSCHKENKNPHNKNQLFTPNCVQCYFEHKGNPVLANIEDKFCTQCHSNLLTKGYIPSPTYARQILGFNSGHPEFAVAVRLLDRDGKTVGVQRVRLDDKKNLSDNTPIKLNHKLHINPPPEKKTLFTENLGCETCHRLDAKGKYMLPINYNKDCARCHPLEFDSRFGNKTVPHEFDKIVRREPKDVIDEFLQKTYTEYAVNNANRLGLGGSADTIKQWVSLRVKKAEDGLFRENVLWPYLKCNKCHTLKETDSELPKVVRPEIPVRWLPHSMFSHELHVKNLGLSCDSCHDARNSEKTTDVLMPSITTCQQCHSPEGSAKTDESGAKIIKGGARTDCVLCHQYHKRDQMTTPGGTKSIKEILEKK